MPHLTRRALLRAALHGVAATALLPVASSWAFGTEDALRIGLLHYPSDGWNLRSGAIDHLLTEIELSTSILVAATADVLNPGDELRRHPLIFVTGDRAFDPWSQDLREQLRRYLQAGGMLAFDSSEGRVDGEFYASARRELSAILPESSLDRLQQSHVVFKSFYLCRGNEGRRTVAAYMEGVHEDGRLKVLFSHNDLLGAWARSATGQPSYAVDGGEQGRAMALRFGVNLVMYALTLDYKEDQVHVPFLLRRRRWRVP